MSHREPVDSIKFRIAHTMFGLVTNKYRRKSAEWLKGYKQAADDVVNVLNGGKYGKVAGAMGEGEVPTTNTASGVASIGIVGPVTSRG